MSIDRRDRRAAAFVLIVLALLASLSLHLWGIERNLPDARDVDEDALFRPAVQIAATGNLNPHWFGYPGSTVIYPLAALLHVQQAALYGGSWTKPNLAIAFETFVGNFARYVRTGRYLSVAYGVGSVALAAWLAWSCFGAGAAVVTAVLAAFSPVAIEYAQPLRSDSAATFYGLLFLGIALRAHATPTARRQILAGCVLGLAIASRYMMASTGLVLAVLQLRLLREAQDRRRPLVRGAIAAWLAVAIVFFATTPYMILDAHAALENFMAQARDQMARVGIDQLGFTGNLAYYLGEAIPEAIGWPQYGLALLASGALLLRRSFPLLLLPLYVLSLVVGVSLLGIHWQRWAMPVLPVLAILAAQSLVGAADVVTRGRTPAWRGAAAVAVAVATVVVTVRPAQEAIFNTRINATPSTEVMALDWVLANVPERSRIAYEWYSAPLASGRAAAKHYKLLAMGALAQRPLETYRSEGWEYLLISSGMYGRYTRDPEHNPVEVEFYQRLREIGTLVYEITPVEGQRGPVVSVLRLDGEAHQPGVDSRAAAAG